MQVNGQPQAQGRMQVLWGLSLCKFWDICCGQEGKITNTKLSKKVNIYFWPLTGPWKGPVQVKGPES
jgi:hypothetical protein